MLDKKPNKKRPLRLAMAFCRFDKNLTFEKNHSLATKPNLYAQNHFDPFDYRGRVAHCGLPI
jgi:hypothetical protein